MDAIYRSSFPPQHPQNLGLLAMKRPKVYRREHEMEAERRHITLAIAFCVLLIVAFLLFGFCSALYSLFFVPWWLNHSVEDFRFCAQAFVCGWMLWALAWVLENKMTLVLFRSISAYISNRSEAEKEEAGQK